MKSTYGLKLTGLALALVAIGAVTVYSQAEKTSVPDLRAQAQKNLAEGNWRDAYEIYQKLTLNPENSGGEVAQDLANGVMCLQRLARTNETDRFIEATVAAHPENWRLLQQAANLYLGAQHYGYMISGKYERGDHRGGGRLVNSLERDRVRAMQLMMQAMPIADKDDNKGEVAQFYMNLANQLLYNRGFYESWRLQYLSNFAELPDYDEGYPAYRDYAGAPVDEEGNPVFYTSAKSWNDAENDGQRWRWALEQVVENNPSRKNEVLWHRAQFSQNQYGVNTLAQFGIFMPRSDKNDESGTYALHTLGEDETIARLATGIKRFKLPDEFNHLALYRQIAAEPKPGYGEEALNQLANIFLNRRQYPKAADEWRASIKQYGPGHDSYKQKQLDQIVANWGRFEATSSQPANSKATIDFIFRNGKSVKFTAHRINEGKLLDDVKNYIKSNPARPDWQQMNIGDIGYRIVHQGQTQYLGEEVAKWDLALEPRPNHFDKRVTITTPLEEGGAYLLTAEVAGGNTSKVIIWVADSAILRKQLSGKSYYYVGDAVSGKPIRGAEMNFFGYRHNHTPAGKLETLTREFKAKADDDGQLIPEAKDLDPNFQWLITASDGKSRSAWYGFNGVWTGQYHDADYNAIKAFTITDRPVYRPGQKVNYKFWVRHAKYDQENTSDFAGRTFPYELYNPKGEKVASGTLETDDYGGCNGEWEIPADATLGQYNLVLNAQEEGKWFAQGNSTFRIEEYKKPEFEVSIEAPDKPVMLGEKITAKINAKYYFGSPVVNAKVKYKIMRTTHEQNWYPVAYWDWFYEPGYWWFAPDHAWYPGFHRWVGCFAPRPWWWGGGYNPPELVAENEIDIGPDGTVNVEIDTEIAKELHGDSDHKYTITAEVRDESRRTIVGSGDVLVAREPFKVFSWVNRGYYRVGEVIESNFKAQTLDNKPVEGEGALTLYKITYVDKDGQLKPVETPVRRWELATSDEGTAQQQIKASAAGQYRLSYQVTDNAGHKIEGAYLFTIIGDEFDGEDYRFNDIELITDKKSYAPGDKVQLQVNTNQPNSTVLLFVRPSNGVYLKPQILDVMGKSQVHEIEISKKDMPNFYVEAVTIAGGRLYSTTREIIVPPEKRVVNVEVLPSAQEYLPGQKAKVKFKVTDFFGNPFEGSTAVTMYDKAVEYISGGSNVGDIKEFFWKWRRRHHPQQETSLTKHSNNFTLPHMPGMGALGMFGHTVADEVDTDAKKDGGADDRLMAFGGGGGGGGMTRGYAMQNRMANSEAAMAPAAPGAAMADAAGPPMAKMAMESSAAPRDAQQGGQSGGPGGSAPVEPTVRTNFADSAFWKADLRTNKEGIAEIELDMPENLSAWKIKVWAMGHGTKCGSGDAEVVTRKNLIIRLQAPRFFVQKDEVVLSANVHNYLKTDKEVKVSLEMPSEVLEPMTRDQLVQTIKVPAGGEQRVDWRVKVANEGEAVVRMKAITDEESDAMEQKFPAYVHGMLKQEAWAGTVRPDKESATVKIRVPSERRPAETVLEVRYSPTLAAAMVDALPYMLDYPYGCTEQTLNRFLPAVITQKTLKDMGIDLADVKKKRTNLNAQEIGDDAERAAQWKRLERNPVFDEQELLDISNAGIKRLQNMQCGDGGWGWFSGPWEQSYPHTTAVVVHGLQIAKTAGVTLPEGMLERGVEWLKNYQLGEVLKLKNAAPKVHPWKDKADNLDAMVYYVLSDADQKNGEMMDFLYRDRVDLAVYSMAMFGLALEKQGEKEKLDMVAKNIDQFLVQDEENETAYLKLPENNHWWYWYGSDVEANAWFLKLLSKIDPKGERAPRLVKYLLNNRKHSTYWNSTRDTSYCVEAFADYLKASGELQPDMTVEIYLDGQKQKEVAINKDNLFSFDNKFVMLGADVTDGEHTVELRRKGTGPVYFNAYLTNFTLEDPIEKAGLEVKVERKFYKLVPVNKTTKVSGARGQALDQRVEKYERQPLENWAELTSGDMVEIELEIESKNDYEYILFEDMKAAGIEAVDVQSGFYSAGGLAAYREMRDDRVSFFVRWLGRGKHSISYRVRAEIPGKFSALPAKAYAMYAPELKGNSDEMKLQIVDEK